MGKKRSVNMASSSQRDSSGGRSEDPMSESAAIMDGNIWENLFKTVVKAPLKPEPNWDSFGDDGAAMVEVVRPDSTIQPVPASELQPGMIVRLKQGDEVPADLIIIGGDQSKRLGAASDIVMTMRTEPYDGTVAYDTFKQFLVSTPVTEKNVSAINIEMSGYKSSADLNTWFGTATIDGEECRVNREDTLYDDWKGLAFRENMLGYKMEVQYLLDSEYIYGVCYFTGKDCKRRKWDAIESELLRIDLAKNDRRKGRITRGMFTKRRNDKLDKASKGVVSLTDHRPAPKGPSKDPIQPAVPDDDADSNDSRKKLLPTENKEKRKMYWALIIGGIALVLLAIILIIVFMFVVDSSSSGSSSAPAQVVITSATTVVSGKALTLAFAEPSNNGATISSYTCFATASGVTTNTTGTATCVSSTCSFTCSGLTTAIEYSITMYATNAEGPGTASAAVSGTPLDSQRTALQALYTGAGGANWKQDACPKDTSYTAIDTGAQYWGTSGTFNSTGDYCDTTASWAGVQCDSDGVIINLSLDGFYMVGTVPTEIGLLTGLTMLNLANNPNTFQTCPSTASGCTPGDYCQFTNGQRGTAGGGLSGSVPTEIGLLTQLTTFNVQSTYLSGSIPAEFDALTVLEEFKISKTDSLCYSTADGLATGTASTATSASCSSANSLLTPVPCSTGCSTFQTKVKSILDTSGYCATDQDDDSKTILICDGGGR